MTERERLTKIIKDISSCKNNSCLNCCASKECFIQQIATALLENGVIVPPCKVGDSVYRLSSRHLTKIKYIEKSKISRIAVDKDDIYLFCECNPIAKCIFNKTVFLSREEAEKAKEREK